jgi:hypothetical protein
MQVTVVAPFPSTLNTLGFRATLQPTFKYFDIEFWRLFVSGTPRFHEHGRR